MYDDLSDAQAAVDWAVAQLPTLERRFVHWSQDAYRLIDESHPELGQNFLKLRISEPFPRIFNAEVGAIINSIRSALDMLAVAVAKRHSVLRWHEMFFPIARSAAEFSAGNYKGSELVKSLPADTAQHFEALKPYPGGNDALVTLHELDILRKHRRLIGVKIVPSGGIFASPGMGFPTMWKFEDDAVIAWYPFDGPKGQFQASLQIAFDEGTLLPNQPVVPALGDLASLAESIIQRFA